MGTTTGPTVPDSPVLDVHRIVQTDCTTPRYRPSPRAVEARWYRWLHSERVPGLSHGGPGPGQETSGEPSPGTNCSVTGVATKVTTTLPAATILTIGRQLAAGTQNHVSMPTSVRTRRAGGAKNGTGRGKVSDDRPRLAAVRTRSARCAGSSLDTSMRSPPSAGSRGGAFGSGVA